MLKIDIRVVGDVKMEKLELRSAMEQIAKKWYGSVLETFAAGGRPEKWAPLTQRYLKRKIREGYPSTPLVRTGEMRDSIKYEYSDKRVRIWTDSEKAVYHHLPGNRTDLPPRPFFVLQQDDMQYAENLLGAKLVKTVVVIR